MSLIPANAIILSKLKFLIKDRFKDDTDTTIMDIVLKKLGPFHFFKVAIKERDIATGCEKQYDDILINALIEDNNSYDCCDKALLSFTRAKMKLRESLTNPCVVRVCLIGRDETREDIEANWFDVLLDEFYLNVKGLQDDKGNELAYSEKISA